MLPSRLGFVGLGNMGAPMVANLAKALVSQSAPGSEPLLCLHDATPGRAAEVKARLEADAATGRGLRIVTAEHVGEVSQSATTVCLSLPSEAAGRAVVPALTGGVVECVIDHGTASPGYSAACWGTCAAAGLAYLDAPVSGGPEGAKAGTLAVMVGAADAEDFERQRTVLEAVGNYVVLLGPAGAGTAAKLVNQMLVGIHTCAAAEAVALAQALGIRDLDPLLELLDRSWGNSVMLQRSGQVLAGLALEELEAVAHLPSGAPIRNLVKDLDLIHAAADGLPLPAMSAAHASYHLAKSRGMDQADLAALVLLNAKREPHAAGS